MKGKEDPEDINYIEIFVFWKKLNQFESSIVSFVIYSKKIKR